MHLISFTGGLVLGMAAAWITAGVLHRRRNIQILRLIHDCRHLHPANTLARLQKHLETARKLRLLP